MSYTENKVRLLNHIRDNNKYMYWLKDSIVPPNLFHCTPGGGIIIDTYLFSLYMNESSFNLQINENNKTPEMEYIYTKYRQSNFKEREGLINYYLKPYILRDIELRRKYNRYLRFGNDPKNNYNTYITLYEFTKGECANITQEYSEIKSCYDKYETVKTPRGHCNYLT